MIIYFYVLYREALLRATDISLWSVPIICPHLSLNTEAQIAITPLVRALISKARGGLNYRINMRINLNKWARPSSSHNQCSSHIQIISILRHLLIIHHWNIITLRRFRCSPKNLWIRYWIKTHQDNHNNYRRKRRILPQAYKLRALSWRNWEKRKRIMIEWCLLYLQLQIFTELWMMWMPIKLWKKEIPCGRLDVTGEITAAWTIPVVPFRRVVVATQHHHIICRKIINSSWIRKNHKSIIF